MRRGYWKIKLNSTAKETNVYCDRIITLYEVEEFEKIIDNLQKKPEEEAIGKSSSRQNQF